MPVPGRVARFELDDHRHVHIHVPHAVASTCEPCEATSFRIEVFDPEGQPAAVLTAGDLVGLLGAQAAAQALAAFASGDLARANQLAARAGGAWSGLGRLLAEVSAVRRSSSCAAAHALRARQLGDRHKSTGS